MIITARPFGTTNQSSPETPKLKACAEDSITAIDQVQTAITEPTPKPSGIWRPAITKVWVLLTIARTAKATVNMNTPRPAISAIPRAGEKSEGCNIDRAFLD